MTRATFNSSPPTTNSSLSNSSLCSVWQTFPFSAYTIEQVRHIARGTIILLSQGNVKEAPCWQEITFKERMRRELLTKGTRWVTAWRLLTVSPIKGRHHVGKGGARLKRKSRSIAIQLQLLAPQCNSGSFDACSLIDVVMCGLSSSQQNSNRQDYSCWTTSCHTTVKSPGRIYNFSCLLFQWGSPCFVFILPLWIKSVILSLCHFQFPRTNSPPQT